jgi:tetratricopeptide (TPR) repeat protein
MKRILSLTFIVFSFFFFLSPSNLRGQKANPQDPKEKARQLLEEWRAEEALGLVKGYLSSTPQNPEALELAAEAVYKLGRYEESLKWYDQALALEGKEERRLAMRHLVQQTLDVVRSYKSYSSPHFQLLLDSRTDAILAEYALETLERTHEVVQHELGFSPSSRVRVEIFPDSKSFNAVSTLSLRDIEMTGAVGLCKFNKIMLLSPRALMRGFRWLDSLSHEYIHYALVFLTRNKAPIWLHEGMARYEETRWRSPDLLYLNAATQTLLARALKTDRFVGFKKMDPSLVNLETPEEVQQAYAEAASAIEFIVGKKGQGRLGEFLTTVAVEGGTEKALEAFLQLNFAEFEEEWKKFLRGKGLKEAEGLRVRRYKVKDPAKPIDEEAVELAEIQSVVARNRSQLGDRLLGRGMVKAAQWEYQRARDASPHSALILNKLGKAQVQLGNQEEAIQSFRDALNIDPDYGGAHVNLGNLYFRMSKKELAKEALAQAVAINPFDSSVHALLAIIHRSLGEDEKARKEERILRELTKSKG